MHTTTQLLLFFIFSISVSIGNLVPDKDWLCRDPDCDKNVTQLITSKGYPCEDHTVITPDGYILSLQRIPYGIAGPSGSRPVVFLQHGLLDSSATWVINPPHESLGFILADAGYDVWMGNSRGNTYSHSHTTLSDDSEAFWTFTWDEMGKTDLPTFVNYVLNATGKSSLYYVGHSQGTEQAFAWMNTPEWASKIKLFVALAPVAYLGHCDSYLLKFLAKVGTAYILDRFGYDEFLPNSAALSKLLDLACDILPEFCDVALCALVGCDLANFNESRYAVYLQHFPAGTSTLNMCHYTQQVNRDNFTMYDYGEVDNVEIYGQYYPPTYNVSEVTVKMALFSGGKDTLGDPKDVSRLISELPSNLVVYTQEISKYGHMDFIWGEDAGSTIYQTIISLFQKYA